MNRWFGYLILVMSCLWFTVSFAQTTDKVTGYSLLSSETSIKTEYRFHVDAIDPTPQSNPKGAEAPGYRGLQQLVIYTPNFGMSTQTNGFGLEAVVAAGEFQRLNGANSPIPENGFVISGHGQAGQWMKRLLKPGGTVSLDRRSNQVVVTITPAVYLNQVSQALERAERGSSSPDTEHQTYLYQAKQCYLQLERLGGLGVTQQLIDLSEECQTYANKAFYRSVASMPGEFRGVWVRPTEKTPEEVYKAVAELKAANIQHIFLETYYQGSTVYPSQVMAEYGLPVQHYQFQGWDPLQVWVEAARQHDLKVHAWVQTFFAGNKQISMEPYGPILQKYPQWANVQRLAMGKTTPWPSSIEAGHYFLDPGNPEVTAFLEKLLLEMVGKYHLDGLNLDYIRYPASHSVKNPHYLASTWGYTPAARKAFQDMLEKERQEAEAKRKEAEAKKIEEAKKAGKPLPKPKLEVKSKELPPKTDPAELTEADPLWPRWVAWRKEQVSAFVQNISKKAHEVDPNILVTAVVFPQSDPQNLVKLQDWPRWANQGWIQALTPIGLGSTPEEIYSESLAFKNITQGKTPVYVGVFGMYNRSTPVELLSQIKAVRRAGLSGIVLFERSRLNPAYKEALIEGAFRE